MTYPIGMISEAEKAYFAQCAEQTTDGAIVDLGCWWGASTVALVKGIQRRNGLGVVHAYDRFIWEDWMVPHVSGTAYATRLRVRDSFLPAFQEQTEPWEQWIVAHRADLVRERWQGGPIGLLVVDAMKTWPLLNGIACGFYGGLVPGSVVIHQDFCHWYTPWIVLSMYVNRDAFEPITHVSGSGSMAFRVVTSPSTYPASWDDLADVPVDAAFKWAAKLADKVGRARLAAARVMVDAHQGRWDVARTMVHTLPDADDGRSVRTFLRERGPR